MAKSKSGGTRSYIRGKIGADVYSIGKDGKGSRQQVVRSLAEQVANPQTAAQMFNRMIMSTVMQAVSAMRPIIDHSFDGVPAGQPSISEFIRRNYQLVKADAQAHPASGNTFDLSPYQVKGVQYGPYIISKGNVSVPSAMALASGQGLIEITLPVGNVTIGALKSALGIASGDDYITLCGIGLGDNGLPEFAYIRFKFNSTLADSTTITSDNVASLFDVEGNVTESISLSTNKVELAFDEFNKYTQAGFIISRKNTDGWQHSECTLAVEQTIQGHTADTTLPTYPQGSARFLNGGDI